MAEFTLRDLPDSNNVIIVSEETVRTAATVVNREDSSFQRALDIGQQYKDAGLTPVYLTDYDYKMIWVSYEEGLGESFH
jgi:hypothetical protein